MHWHRKCGRRLRTRLACRKWAEKKLSNFKTLPGALTASLKMRITSTRNSGPGRTRNDGGRFYACANVWFHSERKGTSQSFSARNISSTHTIESAFKMHTTQCAFRPLRAALHRQWNGMEWLLPENRILINHEAWVNEFRTFLCQSLWLKKNCFVSSLLSHS